MGNAVVHFEVAGKDKGALESFYTDLFGWKTSPVDGMPYSMVDKEDDGIAGGIGEAPDGTPGHVTFYVSVDDIEAGLAKAEELGGQRQMGPMDLPAGGQIGLFADPEGHTIGLLRAPQG
jgi:predicted enzyme related to lactoylglutathione lyase